MAQVTRRFVRSHLFHLTFDDQPESPHTCEPLSFWNSSWKWKDSCRGSKSVIQLRSEKAYMPFLTTSCQSERTQRAYDSEKRRKSNAHTASGPLPTSGKQACAAHDAEES